MKQQERQKKSKEKILQAAITEFSASGYDKVTMENICTRHGISKGMMYHYYSGKDDLFLLCVQNMYQMMQQYLEENMAELEKKDALHALKEFWMLRESFFGEHPPFKNIFENALLRTPPHLFEKIEEIRGPIEALNRQFLHRTIGKIELRENLKKENVSIYLEVMESVFWKLVEQYRREQRISDVHSLMEAAGELWDMVLLGVVRQN
ncbi:TetR/AcrR family transcriptional regulator [Negativibacillus massiliensis]|uniref:TetR/AcrR family transcriptional regulator n=1 Tax=Negativibacillus massiliensis TaxID=1871035 RepID=UPI002A7EC627|nr:TetR/AcrR family transcriptional regulator [Negativibacillus massiliensis]MDY4048144.1 TetR/AcrR family transcriptional regulator [Negativibacillus massiliensis]